MRLGVGPGAALLLLFGSLIGSYFNIPITVLPGRPVKSGQIVDFFGMQYVVPLVTSWPGTVLAVNVGGAVIPTLMSTYLVHPLSALAQGRDRHRRRSPSSSTRWRRRCRASASPCRCSRRSSTTAILAFILSREYAAPLAYIGGSMGTLIGADLLNLDKISGLGAPVASIGGAGTFDGIFLTGILAVLLAGIASPSRPRPAW